MHIVLAFILSIITAALVLLNYNQYSELAVIESRRNVNMHTIFPHYKRVSGPVQVSENPIYSEIKPYKSIVRNAGQRVQQPGVLSENFSAGSMVRHNSAISLNQSVNLKEQFQNQRRTDDYLTNTFVGQYGSGGINMITYNGVNAQNLSGFRVSAYNQSMQDRQQSELTAKDKNSFTGSMFGQTESGPSFAKSNFMSTPLGIDPGGDPDDPGQMIPVPDGLFFLLSISLLYSLFLLIRRK